MAKPPTQTISGSVPTTIVKRVREVARLEDRTTSQVVASALDLYTRLPTELHVMLRRIAVERGEEELQRTLQALGRQVVIQEFDAARSAVARSIKYEGLEAVESDDDFLDAAVDIVKASYARDRVGDKLR